MAEDPLPLKKAKITQNAALKKVTKARKIAEEETDAAATAAAEAKVAAEQAAAEVAKGKADEAKVAAEAAFADAQAPGWTSSKRAGRARPRAAHWFAFFA